MVRDLAQAREVCEVSAEAEALLTSPEAPVVLLRRRSAIRYSPFAIRHEVAPNNPYLGIMLPYAPLHHLLLREVGFPVVATSGNLSDEPICTDNEEAFGRLKDIADAFLVHDRPIARHVDDSVAWIVRGQPRLLRRARGYAPLPVLLRQPVPTILAVGAHLKNTVALSVGRQVFISQHIGDLATPEAFDAFARVIADFLRLYEANLVAIAHDLHPDYLSTKWARERTEVGEQESGSRNQIPCALISVQHHHAHLAACLAENDAEGSALGVTWDGTGYGTDGTIWGGEFLLGNAAYCTRVAHLRPFRLPGGDVAVHEPRRVALALLWELYGERVLERDDLAPVAAFRPAERQVLAQMLRRGVNAPVTTSMGRLFDGIAALIGLYQKVDFEGQAAMALEFTADAEERAAYPIIIADGAKRWKDGGKGGVLPCPPAPPSLLILDWQPLVEAVLADLRRSVSQGIIAARFHNALVEAIVGVAQAVGEPRVALTGGCFQNRLLTERAAGRLEAAGCQVLLHRQVPPNDGGISLGQIAVAAARLQSS
jgi:hydrogenase maturation protein HypF